MNIRTSYRSSALISAFLLAGFLRSQVGIAAEEGPAKMNSDKARIDRIHTPARGSIHIRFQGLHADSRYELRTYFGTLNRAPKDTALDIFWGASKPLRELQQDCREALGVPELSVGLLPCALPDAILVGDRSRSWRSGQELMEGGVDIDPGVPGNILWITYKRTGPTVLETSARRIALDGEWKIAKDPKDIGKKSGWQQPSGYPLADSHSIQVPGNVNEVFSQYNGIVWYEKTFSNRLEASADLQPILRFKACSYQCEVWLNGLFVGSHEGGGAPFEFDLAQQLSGGENTIVMRVFFPKGTILDGGSEGPCAYPVFWGMGGLTQGADLTTNPRVRIADVFARTDWKTGDVKFETTVVNATATAAELRITAAYGEHKSGATLGSLTADIIAPPGESIHTLEAVIKPMRLWSLEDPFLYNVTVQSHWKQTVDTYEVPRFGFRDFRVNADGYFELNGKRLLVKSTHSNVVDPLALEGTPRDMTWLGIDLELLKTAGFNMYREIAYSALPEQLDIADELGFLIYNEHQASWLMKDPTKFEIDLPGAVRTSRNHPSLVIWGMLNEVGYQWKKTEAEAIYHKAREFLPKLRTIDDSRLVLLSSGRFDRDYKTGSASNPGSSTWDVYLGGEDPVSPLKVSPLVDGGPYQAGAGDVHIYETHPISPEFIASIEQIGDGTRPIFVSEGGQSSATNPIALQRNLLKAGRTAPSEEPGRKVKELQAIWTRYDLSNVYPKIEDMVVDSQKMAAHQRALFFSIIRSNPNINGYSLTSLTDGGDGEGIMDEFRHFKAGHYQVLSQGWAKLRWCLLLNPSNVYAGEATHIQVSLANEGELPGGEYPARISVSGPAGPVWTKEVTVKIPGGHNPPLASNVFDETVRIGGVAEGQYTLSATLLHRPNAEAGSLQFQITERRNHPDLSGLELTALGLGPTLTKLLTDSGIVVREYTQNQKPAREVILVGGEFKGDEMAWHALNDRIAGGSFAIFLSRNVISDGKSICEWMPVEPIRKLTGKMGEANIFRSDIVARDHPIFQRLPIGVLTPEQYGALLRSKARFSVTASPNEVAAVWINLNGGKVGDGLVLGIYRHQKGNILINSLDLIENIGQPAADRIILNIVKYAHKITAAEQ